MSSVVIRFRPFSIFWTSLYSSFIIAPLTLLQGIGHQHISSIIVPRQVTPSIRVLIISISPFLYSLQEKTRFWMIVQQNPQQNPFKHLNYSNFIIDNSQLNGLQKLSETIKTFLPCCLIYDYDL